MMLVPYSRKNHSVYNPFQDFDDLEKVFFSDRSLGELKTDIKDLGESYALEADLPGFKKEDIHVDVKDNTLSITAERHSEFEQKDKKNSYLRCERSFGSYSRSFDVSGIDCANIKAAYKDGVLTLTLPKQKKEEPTGRRLEIELMQSPEPLTFSENRIYYS